MRKSFTPLILCFFATAAVAQAPQANTVCQIVVNKVKVGMTTQYEQGRAKHMAWHKSQNDTWSWAVWEILSGDGTGDYIVGSCGHAWKDFDGRDKFEAADTVNANATMGASLGAETVGYYVQRADIAPPPAESPNPPAYLQITHFYVKPEAVNDFTDGIKKINAGMQKTNYPQPRSSWYSLANGGRGPHFVLVTERNSISEMQAPPKSLDQMMQEAYGDQGATIMSNLRKAYHYSESELLKFRSDLSYMPAPPKK